MTANRLQSAYSVSLHVGSQVSLITSPRKLLWECPQVLYKLHKGQVTSIRYTEIQKFLPECCPKCYQEQSVCLGHWELDTQHVPGFWSSFSTPQRRSVQLPWPQAHNGHKDLLFTDPLMKYLHTARTPGPFLQMNTCLFKQWRVWREHVISPFPMCRHSTLLVMEKKLGTMVK